MNNVIELFSIDKKSNITSTDKLLGHHILNVLRRCTLDGFGRKTVPLEILDSFESESFIGNEKMQMLDVYDNYQTLVVFTGSTWVDYLKDIRLGMNPSGQSLLFKSYPGSDLMSVFLGEYDDGKVASKDIHITAILSKGEEARSPETLQIYNKVGMVELDGVTNIHTIPKVEFAPDAPKMRYGIVPPLLVQCLLNRFIPDGVGWNSGVRFGEDDKEYTFTYKMDTKVGTSVAWFVTLSKSIYKIAF